MPLCMLMRVTQPLLAPIGFAFVCWVHYLLESAMSLVSSRRARMSLDEKRLAREMHFDRETPRTEVASVLGRALSSVRHILAHTTAPIPAGCPAALTEQEMRVGK